jgi:hypothetical protein
LASGRTGCDAAGGVATPRAGGGDYGSGGGGGGGAAAAVVEVAHPPVPTLTPNPHPHPHPTLTLTATPTRTPSPTLNPKPNLTPKAAEAAAAGIRRTSGSTPARPSYATPQVATLTGLKASAAEPAAGPRCK